MKEKKKIQIPGWLPGLFISSLVVVLLFQIIDVEIFLNSLKSFKMQNHIIFAVLILLALLCRAAAWKFLIGDISLKDAFLIINEGYFFNNFIPRSGEIARAFITSTISSQDAIEVFSSVVFERAVDVIIAAVMFLITLPLAVSLTWIKPIALVLVGGLILTIAAMLFIAVRSENIIRKIDLHKSEKQFFEKRILPIIRKLIQALSVLNKPKNILFAVIWILFAWLIWTIMLFYGIRLINPEAPFWWSVFAEGVLALGIALPSAPAGLGVYEGAMVVALSTFGIRVDSALSLAIILHILQIIITSALGFFGLLLHGLSISNMLSKIREKFKNKKNGKMVL